jgi:hypothetical protein
MSEYLIWSWEHKMWWGPNHCGYTPHLEEAGRYTEAEAAKITVGHIPPGEEIAVHENWAISYGRPPRGG